MITIVDYGMGNLGSVANMLRKLKVSCVVTSDPARIRSATKLILPGVGAFDAGMRNLEERGLIDALNSAVDSGIPLLGICLGMQLLMRHSEEGNCGGLGWIDREVVKFKLSQNELSGRFPLRVPHMDWKEVAVVQRTPLFTGLEAPRFYFVHSFYVPANIPETSCTALHGHEFAAAVQKENVFGVQFHPEKSHKFGMTLLRNFAGVEG